MQDRYQMEVQDNILFAKRNLVDSIYKEAIVEGINVTFPQTEAILEGVARDVDSLDIAKILNLKRAWKFVLDTVGYSPVGVSYIRTLNGLIENGLSYSAGNIRTFQVGIPGTSWIPAMPTIDSIEEDLREASSMASDTDKALVLMLKVMRGQYFEDGNKRTAQLLANHELIRRGRGIVAIPPERKLELSGLLLDFYETGEYSRTLDFLYSFCLSGISRDRNEKHFDAEKEAAKFLKSASKRKR